MKLFIACLTFVVFLASVNADYYSAGRCPIVRVQEDLSLDKHQGRWYKQVSYDAIGADQQCWTNYSGPSGDVVIVSNTKVVNKELETISALLMYYGYGALSDYFFRSDFYILATDYENYSIRYSCFVSGNRHGTSISILTRDPYPSAEVVEEAKAKIAAQGLPLEPLTVTRTKACDPFIN